MDCYPRPSFLPNGVEFYDANPQADEETYTFIPYRSIKTLSYSTERVISIYVENRCYRYRGSKETYDTLLSHL